MSNQFSEDVGVRIPGKPNLQHPDSKSFLQELSSTSKTQIMGRKAVTDNHALIRTEWFKNNPEGEQKKGRDMKPHWPAVTVDDQRRDCVMHFSRQELV